MSLKESDLKKTYGAEHPAAVIVNGMRLPLRRERRFSRSYKSDEQEMTVEISRFMDGSASITALELQQEWPTWTDDERMDFCEACCWLHEQSDFPTMLRFIMEHGGPDYWSGIALSVASQLPRDEAFDTLARALIRTEPGSSSNISQGIALTHHPDAESTLRRHLAGLWMHPSLWEDDTFLNWVCFDVTTCIAHLIELGAPASDFTDQVQRLSQHVCSGNRDSCRNYLSKYFPWMDREK